MVVPDSLIHFQGRLERDTSTVAQWWNRPINCYNLSPPLSNETKTLSRLFLHNAHTPKKATAGTDCHTKNRCKNNQVRALWRGGFTSHLMQTWCGHKAKTSKWPVDLSTTQEQRLISGTHCSCFTRGDLSTTAAGDKVGMSSLVLWLRAQVPPCFRAWQSCKCREPCEPSSCKIFRAWVNFLT